MKMIDSPIVFKQGDVVLVRAAVKHDWGGGDSITLQLPSGDPLYAQRGDVAAIEEYATTSGDRAFVGSDPVTILSTFTSPKDGARWATVIGNNDDAVPLMFPISAINVERSPYQPTLPKPVQPPSQELPAAT